MPVGFEPVAVTARSDDEVRVVNHLQRLAKRDDLGAVRGPAARTGTPAYARNGLLVYPGWLVRFGQMDMLERLRDAGDREAGSPGFKAILGARD
ncbi:MAG: hypothetical protein ACREXU_17940, partial [Gammaproteobacteria bacterium]